MVTVTMGALIYSAGVVLQVWSLAEERKGRDNVTCLHVTENGVAKPGYLHKKLCLLSHKFGRGPAVSPDSIVAYGMRVLQVGSQFNFGSGFLTIRTLNGHDAVCSA